MIHYRLSFEDRFDVIIALGGNLPHRKAITELDLPIIAADKAAINLYKKRIIPETIIGDLDSFYRSPLSTNLYSQNIIHQPDQETNDFEKALKHSLESELFNALVIGLNGGDLEHVLNNWSVLKKYSRAMNLCIWDKSRYGIPISESIVFKSNQNEIISLIPQASAKISTNNLKWNLNNEKLILGAREGARNQAIGEEISIEIHEGELLLFMDSRLPYAPKYHKH